MAGVSFSDFIKDRSRIDRLEQGLARLVIEALQTYDNTDDLVYEACLDAAKEVFASQAYDIIGIVIHTFRDIVIEHSHWLLHKARKHDGAWDKTGPDLIDIEVAKAPAKVSAHRDEITAHVAGRALKFEENGYQPLEIGRALARVSLSLAPIGFITMKNQLLVSLEEGRDQRMRDFLDETLGEDRYPAK